MRSSNVLHDPKIAQLDLLVTERCNLKCVYCFHKQRPLDMTYEIFEKCIDMLVDQFAEEPIFNFFGGEPMLREDFCMDLMSSLKERVPNGRFHFTTNATIYSEKMVEQWFKGEPPIVQVSHDGIHQASLRGQEKIVTGNLKRYIKDLSADKVTTRMTFTNKTVGDLLKNVEYFYDIGVRRLAHQADVTNEWTSDDVELYRTQLDKIYDFIDKHNDLDMIFCNCNRVNQSKVRDRQCSMGRELLSLASDGSIYPCHRAVKFPHFKVGDVFTGHLNRGKFPVLHMDGCSNCGAKPTCHQCFVANYEQNGFLETPVESGCHINIHENKKLAEKMNLITVTAEDMLYAEKVLPSFIGTLQDIADNNRDVIGAFGRKK